MDDKDDDLTLRDRLAIEIFNGLLAGGETQNLTRDMLHYVDTDKLEARKNTEKVIRACYRVADMFRKVRLTTFE